MVTLGRRSFLKSATLMTAGGVVTSSAAVLSTGPSLGQGVPGNSQYGALPAQAPDDVGARELVGRGSQRDARHAGVALVQQVELQIVLAEIAE